MDAPDPTAPAARTQRAGSEFELLRAAFEASRGEQAPFAVLCLRLAHLERLPDAARRTAVQAALGRLLAHAPAARAGGLACDGERWWLMVPGLENEDALQLARELIAGARGLGVEDPEAGFFATLSAGLARGSHRSRPSLETCLAVAAESLEVAEAGGGARAVHSELYATFAREGALTPDAFAGLEWMRRTERLRDVVLPIRTPAPSSSEPEPEPEPEAAPAPPSEPVAQVADQHILERRLAKLARELALTEAENAELRRRLRAERLGIASVYREVQGLDDDEPFGEVKRELMRRLFVQNVDLRDQVKHGA